MSQPLEILPQALLDELVTCALKLAPSLRVTFLSSLGSRIHASAVRVLFSTLTLQDDAQIFGSNSSVISIVSPLLSNPRRYAQNVKTLILRDPDVDCEHSPCANGFLLNEHLEVDTARSREVFRPIDANNLALLLEVCCNLEGFVWQSSIPPHDGLCEVLLSHSPRLTHFSYTPYHLGPSSARLAKWDALSLPLLSSLPITFLHLSRLSQAGARAFSALLSNLGEDSSLEDVSVNFVWLDDTLCEKIAEAGRRIRKLSIGTSGTKLTDKGITAIVERCDALEDLVLDEIQGRLSRSLWTKPSDFPATLQHLRIVISETGPHHSWTTDHLLSLHALPVESLSGLSVVRREAFPRLENGIPTSQAIVDDIFALKPVPREFVEKMRDARSLTTFQNDWWAWNIADLKVVLESCPNLETMKFCLDAPFPKLMGLASTFASLSNLHKLSVSINSVHAPGKPPDPVLPFPPTSLPTPTESPVLKAKSVLPQLLDFDQMQTQTCLANPNTGDPSMPLLRDIKRFVRKCPRLAVLEWYGKAGRGYWTVTRPTTTSRISINVSIEYNSPMITVEVWKAMLLGKVMEDALGRGWVPRDVERVGHGWTGETAEALAAECWAEKEKEDSMSPVEKERPGRIEAGRKMRIPSVSSSSSSGSDITLLSTPTRTSQPISPVQIFSPMTPLHSETSISTIGVSGIVESSSLSENDNPSQSAVRKRSEPNLRLNGTLKGRMRSATTSSSKDNHSERNGYFGKNAGTAVANSGVKYGRGGGIGRGNRKSVSASGDATLTASAPGRGRVRRGAKTSTFALAPNRGKKPSTP